jgi:phosphoribosylaminoimidazole (AIR) synthetase
MVELGAALDPITRWRAWNQGHGMILALAGQSVDAALAALRDQGHAAAVIGEVVSTPGITIQPAGAPAIRFEATP